MLLWNEWNPHNPQNPPVLVEWVESTTVEPIFRGSDFFKSCTFLTIFLRFLSENRPTIDDFDETGFPSALKMFFFEKQKLALFGRFLDQISYQNHCELIKADIVPKRFLMGAKLIYLCLMCARTGCDFFTSLFSWGRRTSSIPKSWKNPAYNAP